eukprot:4094527-Amphidinium_carterae.2
MQARQGMALERCRDLPVDNIQNLIAHKPHQVMYHSQTVEQLKEVSLALQGRAANPLKNLSNDNNGRIPGLRNEEGTSRRFLDHTPR